MTASKKKLTVVRPKSATRRWQELQREHDYEAGIPGAWNERDSRYSRTNALIAYIEELERAVRKLGGKVTVEPLARCSECARFEGEEHKMDCSRTEVRVVTARAERVPTRVRS